MKILILLSLLLLPARPLLWAQSEGEQGNLFSYGVGVSTEYGTDSVDFTTTRSGNSLVYSVQPQLALQLNRPRWRTSLDYQPSFTYSPRHTSQRDGIAQSLGFVFSRQVTKRLTFDLETDFLLTNNPFDDFRVVSEPQPGDPFDSFNDATSGEVVSRRVGNASMDFSYMLSKRSRMGVGASLVRSDYREAATSDFDDSRRSVTESAHWFYSRQLGPRSSAGLRYAFQKLDVGRGDFKTDSHTVMFTWDFSFGSKLTLSTFVGPNYSESRTRSLAAILAGTVQSQNLSTVGGATFGWKGRHHDFGASAVRRIDDGDGARGSVLSDTFSLNANRQLSARTSIDAFVSYDHNKLLLPVAGPDTFNYLKAGVGLERTLTQNTTLALFYWRLYKSDAQFDDFLSGNRVGIRLAYTGQRPLGR